ncbi:putative leucine-rich repeat-containing protein DDB_G0290503 isoform X3 [Linepithema humile]|uniref:putative leucine-rich repeat-containing protein DDB_G0290503 isoform X3 n=1 Tax=Linepithema humile TaxID=83485 RepID=UPI00351EA517
MEEPQSTWLSHPIKKIYGTYSHYAVARKKLKEAEEISDLNSGTEKNEYLKRSRKIRAAKLMNSSMSGGDELSDENLLSDLPTVPKTSNMTTKHVSKKQKLERRAKEELQKHTNEIFDGDLDCITMNDCNNNLKPQCKNFSNTKHNKENYDKSEMSRIQFSKNVSYNEESYDTDDSEFLTSNLNRNNTGDTQCTGNFITHSEANNEDNIASDNCAASKKTAVLSPELNHEQKNFQHFLIRKVIHLELALNDIKKNQKIMLQKLSIDSFHTKEKETIDTLNDFPLKDQNDLDTMEIKLQNDSIYRDKMKTQLTRVLSNCLKTSCLRLIKLIFSNQFALNYSWFGAKKKQNFSTLNVLYENHFLILQMIRSLLLLKPGWLMLKNV